MDEYGNPRPGSSKEFENKEIMKSTATCDFAWLENEFHNDDVSENLKNQVNKDGHLNNSCNFKMVGMELSPINIEDFFEEIKDIDFSQNTTTSQNNNTYSELLERCNNFIDTVGRNIVNLEEMILEVERNIKISKRNATKAYKLIRFENKSMSKTLMQNLKVKAHLANFFKIGLSNCPHNPHLKELYESGKLILSYNNRFILQECIERNLWDQEFKNKLEQAIHAEVLNKIKTPMLEQHLRLGIDRDIQKDPQIRNKIIQEMLDIENELEVVSNTPFRQLVFQFMDSDTKYDWLQIAKATNKPDLQCRRFWNLMLKPHISRAKWTTYEDNKLIELAKKYKERNWQQIAYELDTNRNELQCFIHYQKNKKMLYKRGKWAPDEDQMLLKMIKRNSIDGIIDWQKVNFAMHDSGRSVEQIYNRWTCCLKPGIKKGTLSEKEKFIINIAQKRNLPPSVVSMNLTNRTTTQVRNAYRRITLYEKPEIFKGGWTPEEDKALLCAVNPYAPNELSWSQVAKQVYGRNAEQCRHRFKLIERKVQENPKMTVDNFPRSKRQYILNPQHIITDDDILNKSILQENFEQNRQLLKKLSKPIETEADRKLKKSFLDNIYVTKHCHFSSKCDLLKYVLDYLGADLVVPKTFAHIDDLNDEGLMSMMTYLKECSIEVLTLELGAIEENTTDMTFHYEGVHDVLRTSDIINSDISELEGLFDIRMRNVERQKSKNEDNQNLVPIKEKTHPLPLYYMGSVPPNFETFRMLYTYINSLTCMKTYSSRTSTINFNWNNEESKKLHQRLVAIFRWPALFSGMVNYNAAKINMIINTDQTMEPNYSEIRPFHNKKKRPHLNLDKFL